MKMKNKAQVQSELKKKHKSQVNKNKCELNLERKKAKKVMIPKILIVCEGVNTEPSYFKQFRISSAVIKTVGTGFNTISLVKKAAQLSKEDDYDQVWCVFDADPKPDNPKQLKNFDKAISDANKHGFHVAYSHQAFEYWLILHLDDHQGCHLERSDYKSKINKTLCIHNLSYDDDKNISEDLFDFFRGIDPKTQKSRTDIAIKRAESIYKNCDKKKPSKSESSTTVFKLVRELMKYCID